MAKSIHLLLPRTAHARLMGGCDRGLPVYEFLANGVIEKDGTGQERVRVFCDEPREQSIREFIKQAQPELIFVVDRVVFADGATGYRRLIA